MHEQTFRGGCYLFTDKVTKFQKVKAMSEVREIVGNKASKLKKKINLVISTMLKM